MRSSFKEFLKFRDKEGIAICAEIGVAAGFNAKEMLDNLADMTLYLIDPYCPYFSETDKEKQQSFHDQKKQEMLVELETHKARCEFIFEDSETASQKFCRGLFDYVYIDANHDVVNVIRDIVLWKPKVKKGGILAGHDFNIVGQWVKELLPEVQYDNCDPTDPELKSDWWVTV